MAQGYELREPIRILPSSYAPISQTQGEAWRDPRLHADDACFCMWPWSNPSEKMSIAGVLNQSFTSSNMFGALSAPSVFWTYTDEMWDGKIAQMGRRREGTIT